MNEKKTKAFALAVLLLAMTAVTADDDKSYTIDQAFIELTVENNGLLHVNEIYEYNYLKLNVSPYGGILNYGWMDTPLSFAGRVMITLSAARIPSYIPPIKSN